MNWSAVCWHAVSSGTILSIESVWVAENYRGQGIAARLLKEVEEEAKAAGCYMAQLDTFDFQAPGFYEKQGL